MIGYFNYTVWLTYMSLLSAVMGILVSLHGGGHPYWGIFFLMFSGFCDAFDGRVARSKKNRTETEKGFGIQIDSLSDLVAFGVLPACIGEAMGQSGPGIAGVTRLKFHGNRLIWVSALMLAVMMWYCLAALIRLAYFNVMEEERQKTEGGCRKTYEGLPVTSSALIFPTILLLQYVTTFDITILYFIALIVTGFLFLSKIRICKPGLRGILFMVAIGIAEGVLLLLGMILAKHVHL